MHDKGKSVKVSVKVYNRLLGKRRIVMGKYAKKRESVDSVLTRLMDAYVEPGKD
jgi:hypothetical protein